MPDNASEMISEKKMTKLEYIRIIGLWTGVMALVVFSYQLGQWNALNIINEIHTFCGNTTIANVDVFGNVGIIQNITHIALP